MLRAETEWEEVPGQELPLRSLSPKSRGRAIATLLAGSWRPEPPPYQRASINEAGLASQILETGAGGLAWWRVRDSGLDFPGASELQEAYRLQTLQSGIHEGRIQEGVALLRAAYIEPLLAKGWLAAGLYAQRGLRPYGDIDLWVRPDQGPAAFEALGYPPGQQYPIDLHANEPARDRTWDELMDRSHSEPVGHTHVQALGAEDHLYLLSVHMLAHGAWRPLWLCDVAAALESLPKDFDWDYCLRGGKHRPNWLTTAIGLCSDVLGASPEELPISIANARLPRWLVPAVLRSWGVGTPYMHTSPVGLTAPRPTALWNALRIRWPNPIQVTVDWNRGFDRTPRLPVQLAECFVRSGRFLLGRQAAIPRE
ncbi:MAG: nucleotidyltransferase family protein [Gemmatimonadota bacterium]